MPWWAGSADLVPSGNADDQNGGWAKPTGPAFGRPDDRLRVPTATIPMRRGARFALPILHHPTQAPCLSAARSGRSKAQITAPAAIATAAIIMKKSGFAIVDQKLPR